MQFPYSQTERTVYIKYSKRPVDLNDVDTSTYYLSVPNPHYEEYIKYYTMARMYRHLMKREMATDYEIMAKATLKEAAAYDSRQHASNKVPIRTKWDNPSQLLYKNSPRTRS